ncbi:MAG: hypothetical protein LBF74_07315 [Treponema sp.]|jgi:hypothetical protein|nr:hypothetical protein [Treponema sp.]
MSGIYKDSLFRSLFNNRTAFLSLYNAVSGKNYDENTEVLMNTLPETLFTMRKNDVSGIIAGKLVLATEHQSSLNENMPLRFLSYIARLFENYITDKSAVYREKLIKMPRPEFIVLCKAPAMKKDKQTLKLSDAFEDDGEGGKVTLELAVTVININEGYNHRIIEKCPLLHEYVRYIDLVEATQKRIAKENPGMSREQIREKAIADSISYCKRHNILKDFFEKLSPEEVNMLTAEWNLEDAIKVAREESWERGREEGREEGIERGREEEREKDCELFSSLMSQAKSMDELKQMFETTFTRQS